MSISPTTSPFSSAFWFGRFMWIFMTCFAIICSEVNSVSDPATRNKTYPIALLVVLVLDYEDHVKPR